MDYYQLIKTRETIRQFDPDKKVPKEVLSRILNAGILAPSAANRQPWTFIMASTEPILSQIKNSYQRDWFQQAPHVLVVVGDKTKSWVRPYDGYNSIETDLAIAMDHMILAAEYENLAACWIIAFDYEKLSKAINLKKDEVVYCMTPLGYPPEGFKKQNNKKRKSPDEIVRWL